MTAPVTDQPAPARAHRLIKVCGATSRPDVALLAAAGADLVGLWYGVPGGPADLRLDDLVDLARAARSTGRLEPVLVTFLADPDRIATALRRSGIGWVQLHAYQTPGMVRALRAATGDGPRIVKVLHLRGGECVERRFVPAYARAGTDVFLLDAATDDGRVGSTGRRLAPAAVTALADTFDRPFLLAGGLSAENAEEYAAVAAHPRLLGIDVDTAARDAARRFQPRLVADLVHRWQTGPPGGSA